MWIILVFILVFILRLPLSLSVGIDEVVPHLASQHRNVPAQDCSGYCCLNLTIPLLDHSIAELDTRFDTASSQHIIEFIHLLPSFIHYNSNRFRIRSKQSSEYFAAL